MRLETEEGSVIDDPTGEQLRETLAGLGGASGAFAILTRADEPLALIQTHGEAGQFAVEYHENATHYLAEDRALPLETIVAMFQAYNRGDPAWREMATWKDITAELANSGSSWVKVLILAVAAVLVAVILYLSFTH